MIGKRKQIVWQIEKKLAADDARPVIFYPHAANCWQPYVKGLTIMSNSIYNGWRFEDLWLDKYLPPQPANTPAGSRRGEWAWTLMVNSIDNGSRFEDLWLDL